MTAITMPARTPLEQAREDVARYQELYYGLRDGTLHWSCWRDDLLCPERTEVAREECYEALRQAQEEVAQLTRNWGKTR